MNAPQVARDYAAEEGLQYTDYPDGYVDIWHSRGAARVYPDGQVRADANPLLASVLRRKIAQAWAREIDPSTRCVIKFSARYQKMPEDCTDTQLLAVLRAKRGHLSPEFLAWDTRYADRPGSYQLPGGQDFLVLLLNTAGKLWTTIRAAYPPEKEEWYRDHIGEIVEIRIEAA